MVCKTFDGQVARLDSELTELTKQFVSVRLVRMNDADLDLFQFDYDLTWAAFFMNADGSIYGRYGTRASHDAMTHMSLASLKKAMLQALELHKNYPNNRHLLEAKRGPTPRFKSVREIAPLKKQLESKPHGQDQGCIHCHMVHEGIHEVEYSEGSFKQDEIWVYPLPENIGLAMDVDDGTKVREILPRSFAEKSGLQVGDNIHTINGQIILSQADIQWVLHWLPTPGTLQVEYFRNDNDNKKLYFTTITVDGDWRKRDISWRASMWGLHPRLGLWAPELSIDEKKALGLAPDRLALRVQYPSDPIKKAGLRSGDIIVVFDGSDKNETSLQLNVRVRLNYKEGTQVPVAVLRDGKRVDLTIPLE